MDNLGYANSWNSTPDQIKKCKELKHTLQSVKINRCLTKYICSTCNYEYKVDSSD
jgi:transposase-like protein